MSIIFWFIAIVLLGMSISTAGWYKLWVFEILGTAYIWFASATLLLLSILLFFKSLRRKRRLQIVLAIALVFYAECILGWYAHSSSQTKVGGIPVTVMIYNVNYQLWNTVAVEKLVRAQSADIFGLVEPYKEQAADLWKTVQDIYPHYYRSTGGNWQQVLVFTRIKHGANRLAERLSKDGLKTTAIHGNKTQAARLRALNDFKEGKVRVLVATDVASRGLDIDQLPYVVNFDLPNVPEDYVHRIGRTGRAGHEGRAISQSPLMNIPS